MRRTGREPTPRRPPLGKPGGAARDERSAAAAADAAEERLIDQVLMDSFPASDPPPWTLGVEHRDRAAGPRKP